MKTSIKTIILAAASVFAAMSCRKEAAVPETQSPENAGETIQVNINASLGDLVSADDTKATAESVIRLRWEGTESTPEYVKAYCGTTLISTGNGLKAIASENGLFAKLTGEITTTGLTSGTSVITFIYSNGCTVSNDGLTFDFSSQDANIPFVAYATLVYDGTATLTDKMVEFKFATSVMKIAATNLGGGKIQNATIGGINTKVTLTPDAGSETCGIAGSEKSKITKTAGIAASSDYDRAIITVGLVPDNTSKPYRMLTVNQAGYTNKGVITSTEIESSTSYTTPASLFPCGQTIPTPGSASRDYVLIAGTKWATQNLALSISGQKKWKSVSIPSPFSGVEDFKVGDYFQWAAYEGYTTEENSDKGLLIYKSFTNEGSSSASFTEWKKNADKDYYFNLASISPYLDISYKKYTSDGAILAPSDDVASILWGDGWRMPTSAEFKALVDATYWQWDGTDLGYYVYAPQPGDAGGRNGKKSNGEAVIGTYEKSSALLFFPAAGQGSGSSLNKTGENGFYWSSTLGFNSTDAAWCFKFDSNYIYRQNAQNRGIGCSVRPVSD